MTTHDDLPVLSEKPFSDAVEEFDELLIQSGGAFLIGAGCSKCAGLPLTAEFTKIALESNKLDETSNAVLAAIKNRFDGSKMSHVEDCLSELVDLHPTCRSRYSKSGRSSRLPRISTTTAIRPPGACPRNRIDAGAVGLTSINEGRAQPRPLQFGAALREVRETGDAA